MNYIIDDSMPVVTVREDDNGRFVTAMEAYGYIVDNDMRFEYEPTHASFHDGSNAMLTQMSTAGYSVHLINEDGHQWCDPAGWWIPLDKVTDDDRERWAEIDGNEDDFDYTFIDYPEYDPDMAFYEREGRPRFPNEW